MNRKGKSGDTDSTAYLEKCCRGIASFLSRERNLAWKITRAFVEIRLNHTHVHVEKIITAI